MPENIIPCGGFYYDPLTIRFVNINGKPTIQAIGGVKVDGSDIDLTQFLKTTGDPFSEPFTSNELYNYSTARVINIAIEITDTDGVDRYCYPVLNRYIVADTQLYGWAGVDGETGVKIDLRKVTSDSDEYEIVCTFPETV